MSCSLSIFGFSFCLEDEFVPKYCWIVHIFDTKNKNIYFAVSTMNDYIVSCILLFVYDPDQNRPATQ